MTARSTATLAAALKRRVHLVHRPLRPPVGMIVSDLARWHAATLSTRLTEPVDIMAISGGGTVALQLALDHVHGPLRLLLCAAFALPPHRQRALGEAALVEAVQHWDVTGRLRAVTVPTLVVGGTLDRLVPRTWCAPLPPPFREHDLSCCTS